MAIHLGALTSPHSPRIRFGDVCEPKQLHAPREISRTWLGGAPGHVHDRVHHLVDLGCFELTNTMSDGDHENDLESEWDPSAHRLPVWATIREAVQAIAKEWKALLKVTAVPAVVVAVGNVVSNQEYMEAVLPNYLAWIPPALLSAGFAMLIAISCHRLVILGVGSLPSAWGLFWSRRETRFLGWSALIGGIAWVLLLVAAFSLEYGVPSLFNVMLFFLIPYAVYVVPRLSLVLPATAIGQRPTLKGSWRLSRSNGWRLALVMLLPSLVLIPLSVGSLQLGGIAPQFLAAFTLVLLWVIGIASLSKAFCWFTGEIEAKSPS